MARRRPGRETVAMHGLPDLDGLALAAMVRDGEASPRELLDAAMAGIEAVDPTIGAIASVQYDVAVRSIEAGLPDGPFTGVPFLLKDLGCDAVDHPCTQGSRLFRDGRSSFDSELFIRLRRTGLVTFGRTTSRCVKGLRPRVPARSTPPTPRSEHRARIRRRSPSRRGPDGFAVPAGPRRARG